MVANEKWFGASPSFYPETIDQSLRFDGSSSYLTKTPSSDSNRRKWTFSAWIKFSQTDDLPSIFGKTRTGNNREGFAIGSSQKLQYQLRVGSTTKALVESEMVLRDVSNFYHIMMIWDSDNGTATNRVIFYVNGQNAGLEISTTPVINTDSYINSTNQNYIGWTTGGSNYLHGYMAEINFVDGHALAPEAFGQTKNGVWIPNKYENKISEISRTDGTAIGDLTGQSGLSASFDGTLFKAYASSSATTGSQTTGYIGKDWGSGTTHTVTGFAISSTTNFGFVGSGATTFTVKLYGSNSTPSNSTDGTLLFTSSSVTDASNRGTLKYFSDTTISSEETISSFNTSTAFRYHWIVITPNTSESIFVSQVQFYEVGTSNYYGTNGFRLTFQDSSNIGYDYQTADRSTTNDYSTNGLASTDIVLDSPTNNFSTWNALFTGGERSSSIYATSTLSEGNLKVSVPTNSYMGNTFRPTSGKWYMEMRVTTVGSSNLEIDWGWIQANVYSGNTAHAGQANKWGVFAFQTHIRLYDETSQLGSNISVTVSAGDILQLAWDIDNNKGWVGINNTWYRTDASDGNPSAGTNEAFTFTDDEAQNLQCYIANGTSTDVHVANFGQDGSFAGGLTGGDIGNNTDANGIGAFKYAPPTGFLALCSSNLPDTTISPNQDEQADDYFDIALYQSTGGSSDSSGNAPTLNVTSLNFQPDWVVIMPRSNSDWGMTFDSNRGVGKTLQAFRNYVEGDYANTLTAFTSNGFTLGADSTAQVNFRQHTYVSWNWKANGTTPTKTYKVVVVSDSGNKFRFRNSSDSATFPQSGVTLDLQENGTYTFDVSDSSMSGHALKFSTTSDGIHGGGSEYTTGVTSSGTSGQSGAYVQITVASSAPTLYYYCGISGHSGMGGQINTNTTHGSTNFDGSIKSVSNASQTSGFSIVTYTGNNGSSGTIGHGLSTAPNYIIVMGRTVSNSQMVGLTAYNGWTHYMSLSNGGYSVPDSTIWNDTAPTSTVFSVGGAQNVNDNYDYVAYCFHDVDGFSKFGVYTGNNSTDGTFVFTGFRPAYIVIKRVSTTGGWSAFDIARNPFNAVDLYVGWDLAYSENDGSTLSPAINIDFLSNGFKIRTTESVLNSSGGVFSYFCFAELPFKFSNAR